jgi:hypothetical protein
MAWETLDLSQDGCKTCIWFVEGKLKSTGKDGIFKCFSKKVHGQSAGGKTHKNNLPFAGILKVVQSISSFFCSEDHGPLKRPRTDVSIQGDRPILEGRKSYHAQFKW